MRKCLYFFLLFLLPVGLNAQSIVSTEARDGFFELTGLVIYVDSESPALLHRSAVLLQDDIERVTGKKPIVTQELPASAKTVIVIGINNSSPVLQKLAEAGKWKPGAMSAKWEAYRIQAIAQPFKGIGQAMVIAGSDRRGTAFGIFEFSRQIGVSPWYWWADVPVKKRKTLYVKANASITDAPAVKYRGIFINDEAPALSGWTKEKFGGFNHLFYEKVFELMLRLKANYLWPAMWGNAFYDDDSLNIKMAEQYGIVIGTSHHEPLMRAHDEWRRYGQGKWNYDSNEVRLKEFWRAGMQRATNEKIVSVGMRGDGDEPMSRETATALLERIVADQRSIIADVTGKPANETPQLWALYKEVQDYYDKGMRVPDDVTLLLCDDNWGNIRRLPKLNDKPRKGGYGIYYHFDYVGGPRNYKWINTNPIARVWEQMHLAWEFKAREIWIVNVGDIKPMEFPISFFLDYAWAPERIRQDQLQKYTEDWSTAQFGRQHAKEIAAIISAYTKYNGRRKPELLNADTYSLENYEADNVTRKYNDLLKRAEAVDRQLSPEYRDAYFQLVLHPVKASANLQEMYTNVALNREAYRKRSASANKYADIVNELYANDSLISLQYNKGIAQGKWNHMMDQTHIGYTYWQQPLQQKMPEVKYLPADSILPDAATVDTAIAVYRVPVFNDGKKRFRQYDNYVSIEAPNFTRAVNTASIKWTVLPDHGRTGSAITIFPVTAPAQTPGKGKPCLEYEVYLLDTGLLKLDCYFSPTLNIHHSPEGLRFAVSIDDGRPQTVSLNKDDANERTWARWVANNIIIKTTEHKITKPGKHIIKYWMIDAVPVLQKLVLYKGDLRYRYLGPPETLVK